MSKRSEKHLDSEMQFHLDIATQDYIAKGLSPEEARLCALNDFGSLELAKDEVRDEGFLRFAERLGRDLRYAVRQLYRAPAFTGSVLLTLAVVISANTALFSVVHAVLVQPLPYRDPSRLLCLWHGGPESYSWYTFSHPRFEYFQQQVGDEAELAAYDDETVTGTIQGEAVRLEGGRVSSNFFELLGVTPKLGRLFRPDEDHHGADPVVILSDALWRTRYGADAAILGRSIQIDNEEFTVIGVLPAGFQFLGVPVDVWRSRIVDTRTFAPTSVRLGATYLTVVARLRTGVPLSRFRGHLSAIGDRYSKDNNGNSDILGPISAAPLQQMVFGAVHKTLMVLWGAVICLLFIACANVANLIIARTIARSRELNVRIALGASRMRVAQQLIAETTFLSLCSVAFSIPLAFLGVKALVNAFRKISPAIPEVHLDTTMMAFTVAVTLILGLVMGTIPAGLLLRANATLGLCTQERSYTGSTWSVRLRNCIVAVQIMLSVVLLSAAGLLAKSLLQLRTLNSGLRTEQVSVVSLDLMPDRYASWSSRVSFYDEVLRRVESVPGVRQAAIADRLDLVRSGLGYELQVEGAPDLGSRNPSTHGRSVSPNYFSVLGIPRLRGRVFDEHDSPQSQRVVLINEAFAKKFFPDVNPIGKHLTYSTDRITCEVIGVVGNVRSGVHDLGVEDQIYLPLTQRPWLIAKLLIRSASPEGVAVIVRQRIKNVDPGQAIAEIAPLPNVVSNELEGSRTTTIVVACFGGCALFLVAVGIYGVVAYSVAQRRREIGIRMALGADAHRVRILVLRQILQMLTLGFAVGMPGSFVVSRLYSSLLFATTPSDSTVLIATGTLLLAVTFAATYLPVKQATGLNPNSVLRGD